MSFQNPDDSQKSKYRTKWLTTCIHFGNAWLSNTSKNFPQPKNSRFVFQINANLPNKAQIMRITTFLLSNQCLNHTPSVKDKPSTEKFLFWNNPLPPELYRELFFSNQKVEDKLKKALRDRYPFGAPISD